MSKLTENDLLTFGKPLVEDFDRFVEFLKSRPQTPLTTTGVLKMADLYALNEKMNYRAQHATPRWQQLKYPALHLIFNLAISCEMVRLVQDTKEGSMEIVPETVALYESLNTVEKYFFLVETFWLRTRWNVLEERGAFFIPDIVANFQSIADLPSGKWKKEEAGKGFPVYVGGVIFVWVGYLLGFYTAKLTDKKVTNSYDLPFESVEVTPLGKQIPGILVKNFPPQRDVSLLQQKISEEDWYAYWKTIHPKEEPPAPDMKLSLVQTFQRCFPEGTLQKGLPVVSFDFVPGTYYFRVMLEPEIYRTIAMSAEDTLVKLHLAIQTAYRFDNDHLYAFYMANDPRSGETLSVAGTDFGFSAHDFKIGELALQPGNSFSYEFDFGDSWYFHIEVEKIEPQVNLKTPALVDTKGKAPAQYGGRSRKEITQAQWNKIKWEEWEEQQRMMEEPPEGFGLDGLDHGIQEGESILDFLKRLTRDS